MCLLLLLLFLSMCIFYAALGLTLKWNQLQQLKPNTNRSAAVVMTQTKLYLSLKYFHTMLEQRYLVFHFYNR